MEISPLLLQLATASCDPTSDILDDLGESRKGRVWGEEQWDQQKSPLMSALVPFTEQSVQHWNVGDFSSPHPCYLPFCS